MPWKTFVPVSFEQCAPTIAPDFVRMIGSDKQPALASARPARQATKGIFKIEIVALS